VVQICETDPNQLRVGSRWEKAFYSEDLQRVLGLSEDADYQEYISAYVQSLNDDPDYLIPVINAKQKAFVASRCR